MTRTGLLVALVFAAVVGLVFGLYPGLDLKIAGYFSGGPDIGKAETFPYRAVFWLWFAKQAAMATIWVLIAPAVFAFIGKLIFPRRPMFIPGRAAVFLIVTLALAPG